jgi:colanic acid/amylovoran biosynthesis glycosyltransferase
VKLCVTRSERYAYSETFIRDQLSGLSKNAEVYSIHSGRLPEREESGKTLAPWLFWVLHKAFKGLTGQRNNFFSHYGLKKYFREKKIDVVLANYGISAAHMMPICREIDLPLVAIFHGHDATDKKLIRSYAERYKELFVHSSGIVAVSNDMRDKLIALGATPDKVSVIPCGVDLKKFDYTEERKEKVFLAVGRFVGKKGPLFTIRAFHEVWKKHPQARLIMVGAHRGLYQACVRLVNSLDMQDAVSFPGILSHEEVGRLMSTALAFVQHSVTAENGDMEGTPVSILEAAASGLPVISTFHGGITDAVIHDQTGYLTAEGATQEMAEYMIRLLEDPAQARAMGAAARKHATVNYDQQKQLDKLAQLIASAYQQKKSI